jgi:hypothetical protein
MLRRKAVTLCAAPLLRGQPEPDEARLEIWYGPEQRADECGAQPDFNLLGHVEPWRQVLRLEARLNGGEWIPLSFRAFRRLAEDGDFNFDVSIASLQRGRNTITVRAVYTGGRALEREVEVRREAGACKPLPLQLRWRQVNRLSDAGQVVDGLWRLSADGLRCARPGYDRLFLIGARDWRDFEVTFPVALHRVAVPTTALSGGNGLGVILRFAGHVNGGPRRFAAGQPKWGYQPFGALAWLRWDQADPSAPPALQFYPGDSDRAENFGRFALQPERRYRMRACCQSLEDSADGEGRTEYRFKIWRAEEAEPPAWNWRRLQISRTALRAGGVALVAHHVEATFGDIDVAAPCSR